MLLRMMICKFVQFAVTLHSDFIYFNLLLLFSIVIVCTEIEVQ